MSQPETKNRLNQTYPREGHRTLIWGVGLFLTLILLTSGAGIFLLSDKSLYLPLQLTNTLELISIMHPELYNSGNLINSAQSAVLNELDRYSGLLEPRELNRVHEEFTGSYGGIGISVVGHTYGLMIMTVRDDGPAGQIGIQTGDIIIKSDSTRLRGLSAYQSTYLLRGPEDSPLELTIVRNQMADTLKFNLIRRLLPLIHIPYAGITENNSLYIRITDFEMGVSRELHDVLDSLYLNNPDTIEQLIIDLRGNPGGLLREAHRTANMFLDKDHLIVGIRGRSIWREEKYYSTGSDITNNLPIALIVDRNSASAAEILAGALKYANRAILVGDTTFGKGLVQEFSGLGDGSGLRLTTSRYYFEGEIFLNDPEAEVIDSASGIPPDYYFLFEGRKPFTNQLENSSLLREFAINNKKRIIQYAPFTDSDTDLMNEFNDYLQNNNFEFHSTIAAIAGLTKQLIALQKFDDTYINAIDRICKIAQNDDKKQFDVNKNYIKRRLYKIALESEFGTSRAYHDAILPYREDIRFAESILKSKISENPDNEE
ncbi:MAG: PDZ domain-containing protein [candidate division Zixibacteria bacterium]|nr:PDZ domain-containing protein [candidate division Zixibacteria bacterium]